MFEDLFSPLANTPIYQRVLDSATSPIAGAIILFRGENAIQKVNQIAGDVDPARAAPGTIRKLFGIDRIDNALHVSSDKEMTDRQVGILFPDLRCNPLPAMETGD
jgi:nucleoside-diphosphate kinase